MATKLGFNATWAMAVGGMVGGGIFSTLGVVIDIAGPWAWLSFVAAGLVALGAGYSYAKLAELFGEGGGAFTFLREIHDDEFAASLSWVLIVGYVLTNAVYAFTFGQYLGHIVGVGPWFPRAAAVFVVALFVAINLRGVGEASGIEIFLVWFKLIVLIGLAAYGIGRWAPELLSQGVANPGPFVGILAGASVFMAYEGFQLLTYDYDDIENPGVVLIRAILSAIVVVIVVYVGVAIGTAMLIGADAIVANEEVALAVAGREAAGVAGLVIVTIAAAFSTGSAINSTLFSTARLARRVADSGELPRWLGHRNSSRIPDHAVIALGGFSALLAVIGSLTTLVEAASLAFLVTFTVVCGIAFRERAGLRAVTALATIGSATATIAVVVRFATSDPLVLAAFAVLVAIAVWGRPFILSRL
jgi:amino acid transporter